MENSNYLNKDDGIRLGYFNQYSDIPQEYFSASDTLEYHSYLDTQSRGELK